MMIHTKLFLFAAWAAVLGASALPAGDYATFRGDSSHSGATAEAADFSNPGALTTLFSGTVINATINADPLVVDDRVIVVTLSGNVLCLDFTALCAGQLSTLWSANAGAAILATPVAHAGRLFVGTTDGRVIAYRLADGADAWPGSSQVTHGGYMIGAPVVADDKLIVAPGFGNANLLAYSVVDGSVVWSRPLSRDCQASPTVYEDKVIVALPDGSVKVYNLADGTPFADWSSEGVVTEGVFYGTTPTVVLDPDAGEAIVFVSPGGDDSSSGSSITGYAGYSTYRIKLADGSYGRLIPGIAGSYKAEARGADESDPDGIGDRILFNPLEVAPNELRDQLMRLSGHYDAQLTVIADYELMHEVKLERLRTALKEAYDRMDAYKRSREERAAATSGASSGRGSAASKASLAASSFNSAWPTAGSVRPAPAAYLARGIQRYLAIAQRELPNTSIQPRTLLFSVNPASFGSLYWFYANENIDASATLNAGGPLLVPNVNDPNGAYLVAPLGRNVAVFDAATNNTPLVDIEMPGIVYPSPVFSNGKLVLLDTSGHMKVIATTNAPPAQPAIQTPAEGGDVLTLTSPVITWTAPADDSTAPAALTYRVKYAVNGDLTEGGFVEEDLAAGQTFYDLVGLPVDADIQFTVRAIDANGAAGLYAPVRSFTFQRDTVAPGAASNLLVAAQPLQLDVSFDPSGDEAPDGAADVTGYRIDVVEQLSGTSFSISLELEHSVTIVGLNQNVLTPLDYNSAYNVSVVAFDRRGNESAPVAATQTPDGPPGVDIIRPFLLSATLLDSDQNGYIETVALVFSEDIAADGLNVAGFALDGVAPTGFSGPNGANLTLDFGAGLAGTGMKQLTYSAATGQVTDLTGNTLLDIAAGANVEIDAALPIVLAATLAVHDDDSDGRPNRITVDFSETVDPSSVDMNDVSNVRDFAGTVLNVTGVTLLANNLTLEITLDDSLGVITGTPPVTFDLVDDGNGIFFADAAGNDAIASLGNRPPLIVVTPSAGARFFDPGFVELSASGSSDPDGDSSQMSYEWRIEAFSSWQQPGFYPDGLTTISGVGLTSFQMLLFEAGVYGVRLTLTDQGGASANQLVTFTINNIAPTADAGDDFDREVGGGLISIDGRRSLDMNDPANLPPDIVAYIWSVEEQPAGASALIFNADKSVALFNTTGIPAGSYRLRLTVTDRNGATGSDDVIVRLFDSSNLAPVADAGPDMRVPLGTPIDLDGRFSRDDGALTYTWAQTGGAGVTITSASSATAQVIGASVGSYRFSLTVSDGTHNHTDTVWVQVFDPTGDHVPNVVVAAPSVVNAGQAFTIDASQSLDVGGAAPFITMTHVRGPKMIQLDGGASAVRAFICNAVGLLEVDVTASDSLNTSVPERVRILVRDPNNAPPTLAISGPASATAGAAVSLNFTGSSDAETASLSYQLLQTAGLPVRQLSLSGSSATLVADMAGEYRFELWGRDDRQPGIPASVSFIVDEPTKNVPRGLVANASVGIDLQLGTSALIAAGAVSDADGDAIHYLWVQAGGPTALIQNPTAASTAVELPNINGQYRFELFVDDGGLRSSAGVVTVDTAGGVIPPTPDDPVELVGGAGGCALFTGLYGSVGLPLLLLGLALLGVVVRMTIVYRRTPPSQSI